MTDQINQPLPTSYLQTEKETSACNFTMRSDILTCSLLRTLAGVKQGGRFLELGTGSGVATCWILDGMDQNSTLISVDHDERLLRIASKHLGRDKRLSIVHSDAGEWIQQHRHLKFEYIFADTWHGKYLLLDEVLGMLTTGGFYLIDDMLPQPNWPEGHEEKVMNLIQKLESRSDLLLTKQSWSSGIIIGVKK